MRSLLLIIGLVLCMGNLSAQNNTASAPTDATVGYTYDFDLAKKMIIDHQLSPSADNALAKPIVDSKDFPKLVGGKMALNSKYHEKLRVWMEKNPSLIIESFKSKKEIVYPFGK